MRVIVKVGTSTVHASEDVVASLGGQVASLVEAGHEVAVFSSGAVHAGRRAFGAALDARSAAALGQPLVFDAWRVALGSVGIAAAQVLVDDVDLERGGGAAPVVEALWRAGAVPVLNGNDAIAAGRARVADNDALAAALAVALKADRLLLLTDQDGICTADPRLDPDARTIHHLSVRELGEAVPTLAAAAGPSGRGGMASKARAALGAARGGVATTIANGGTPSVLARVLAGERLGTTVAARPTLAATIARTQPVAAVAAR